MLKGLKITMKIPLTILENACCDAKPMMTAKIPAPANNETAKVFNEGID
jgi:hypothetical protein